MTKRPLPVWRNYGAREGLYYLVQRDDGTSIRVAMSEDADRLVSILNDHGNNVLSREELTDRFYVVKEQRDRFLAFCRVVCPESTKGAALWDHEVGNMFRELMERDRAKLCGLLDKAASYCPVSVQDEIRKVIAAPRPPHPSRLIEGIKAIADHEHRLTAHSVQGLRYIAQAVLDEIDPANDYSDCVGFDGE